MTSISPSDLSDNRGDGGEGYDHTDSGDLEMGAHKQLHPVINPSVNYLPQDVLGEAPEKTLDKIWYGIDPFKDEQMIRSYNNYNRANIYFGTFYFIVIILYSVVTFIDFFNRPVIETYSTVPAANTNPIPIEVSLQCSSKWPCSSCNGTWTQGWVCENGTVIQPTVSESYLHTKKGYCSGISSIATAEPSTDPKTFLLTSCYSADFDDGILIRVPFTGSYTAANSPRMIITITQKDSDMFYQQFLEPAQRKSVFLGQIVVKDFNDPISTDTFVSDLFYDGKNTDATAELRVKVSQFSTELKKSRPGSIWAVYGNIGGFSTFMLPITSTIRDIIMYIAKLRMGLKKTSLDIIVIIELKDKSNKYHTTS